MKVCYPQIVPNGGHTLLAKAIDCEPELERKDSNDGKK